MTRKKKKTTRAGLPILSADECHFAGEEAEVAASFDEMFDTDIFDRACVNDRYPKKAVSAKPLSRSQRIQKYPLPQAQLDLHGCTAVEAIQQSLDFLTRARNRRLQTVQIITGKGLHSEGPAVLPEVVEEKLRELEEADDILAYRWENGSRKASGAVIVFLVEK